MAGASPVRNEEVGPIGRDQIKQTLLKILQFFLIKSTEVIENFIQMIKIIGLFFFFFFETRSCYVGQASLELTILLPQQLSKFWDYKLVPLYLTR
jgi:hypothetical protein